MPSNWLKKIEREIESEASLEVLGVFDLLTNTITP